MRKTDKPVIVEETFTAPAADVWQALTDIEQMHQWYFADIPDFRPEPGFETSFDVDSGKRVFPHRWKVTEVVPERRLTVNWKYEGYPGDSFVIFELIPEKNMTRLRLSLRILEDFPDDIPEFTRESCLEGWRYFIQNRLKQFFENRK